ncbi:hypothetical protein DMH15_25725 [Streptomyces sp. WAC 06725]|nr:hypothetical protein DMH15_25725 [Streptomyces sp. WAC 06725]
MRGDSRCAGHDQEDCRRGPAGGLGRRHRPGHRPGRGSPRSPRRDRRDDLGAGLRTPARPRRGATARFHGPARQRRVAGAGVRACAPRPRNRRPRRPSHAWRRPGRRAATGAAG